MSDEVAVVEPEVKSTETPVATENQAQPDQAKPEEVKTEQPETKTEDKEEKPNRIQARIDKLTREKYELAGRLKAYEQMNGTKPVAQQTDPKPIESNYQNHSDYVEALTDWKVTQRLPQISQQVQQQSQQSAVANAYAARVDAVRAETPDFDEVMSEASSIPIPDAVGHVIQASDVGPRIAYHLATHPEIAERLNNMPVEDALAEIGEIRATIRSELTGKKTSKPVTKAPSPISPVNTGSGAVETNLDKLPIKDFIKARNEAVNKRNKR